MELHVELEELRVERLNSSQKCFQIFGVIKEKTFTPTQTGGSVKLLKPPRKT